MTTISKSSDPLRVGGYGNTVTITRNPLTMNLLPPQGKQTRCTLAVLAALGHAPRPGERCASVHDVVRVLRRHGWRVRSAMAGFHPVATVATVRAELAMAPRPVTGYLLRVPGHVSLVLGDGAVAADTAPNHPATLVTHAFSISRP